MSDDLRMGLEGGRIRAEISFSALLAAERAAGGPGPVEVSIAGRPILTRARETGSDGALAVSFPAPIRAAAVAGAPMRFTLLGPRRTALIGERAFRPASDPSELSLALNLRPEAATIRGWAVGPGAEDRRFALFVDDAYVETRRLETRRDDVAAVTPPEQRLNGLSFPAPASLYDGRPHVLSVVETSALLIARNGPVVFTPATLRDALLARARHLASAPV